MIAPACHRLVCLTLLLGIGACAAPRAELPARGEDTRVVYVVGHGWHTGIVVRRADVSPLIWPELQRFPSTAFVEVGWGDRAFYQAPQPSFRLALQAAFSSKGSVLHVVGFDVPPAVYFPGSEVLTLRLTESGFERLVRFVDQTYRRDAHGKPIPLGPGWYPTSRFYLATGRYHLFNTCNTWVAKALRAGGCPMTPSGAAQAEHLLEQARRCATQTRPVP